MKRIRGKNKYKAVGFVEALIAIMVSGIAATVLLSIASFSLRELIRMDMEDALAQHARSGAMILQNIANKEALNDDSELFESLNLDSCYVLVMESDASSYTIDLENPYNIADREDYSVNANIPVDDDFPGDVEEYFRIMCVEDIEGRRLLAKFVVGVKKMAGQISNVTDIRDYVYFAVINL
jgi:hypothetical protein